MAKVVDEGKSMHSNLTAELVEYPWNLSNREFVANQTWVRVSDTDFKLEATKRSYIWCSESVQETVNPKQIDYHLSEVGAGVSSLKKTVRAFTSHMCIVEPIWDDDEMQSCSRCRVTLLSFTDPKGLIPKTILKKTASSTLDTMLTLNTAFQHNDLVDLEERQKCIRLMKDTYFQAEGYGTKIEYSEDEEDTWEEVHDFFTKAHDRKNFMQVPCDMRQLEAYVSNSKLMLNNLRFTKVATVVDAEVEEVAAMVFLSGNRR